MSDSFQNNQQGEMLRRDYEEIKSHKLRRDLRLSENEQNLLTNDLREYHTVESSQDETRRIENLLLNADVLDLRESEKTDLKFRIRQNKNFELVNTEKTGGDSHFMKAVKDSVKEIDILMRKKAGSAFERHQLLEETRSKVQTGINNCVEYLKRGKPFWPWHKARYNAVEETMQRLTEDMTRLSFALEMDQANDQEGVYDAADTVLDILNSDLLEERRGAEPVGVHHAIRAEMQRKLNGIGGFEYEKDAFRHDIKQAIGTSTVKFEVDRTTATVALFMASKKGVLQDKNQCKDIYKNLAIKTDVEGAQEPTLEDKQKKVDALEEFFDFLLAFDVKNLDGMDYSTFFSSEKFKQNHLIIRAGWDADAFMKEYKKLLSHNQGLRMKYTAEEFSEVEAKRNMLSVLSNLYDAIIAYYDEPSLWDVSLDDIMGYDNDTLLEKYTGVMGAEQKNDNVIRFYSCMYNFRFNEDANTSVVVRNYDITKPAEQLLQAERELYVAPSKLQAEREERQRQEELQRRERLDKERQAQLEREKKVRKFQNKVEALEKELSGFDRKLYKEFFEDITGPVDDLCSIVREFFEIDDETVLNGLLQAGYDNLLLFVKSIDFGKISAFDLDYAKQELLTFAKSEYLRHEEQLKEEEARKKAEEEKTSEQREQDYINSQIFKKRVESVNEDWDPTGVREKKEEGEKKKEWTADEKQTIELLGELTFTTNVTDNRGLAVDSKQRTRGVLLNNTGILLKLLNSDVTDQLRGITNYLTKSEGELLRSIGEVLGDVVEEMKKYHQGSWAQADVTECLKSPEMAKFLEKQDGEIEAALNAGAVRIEKYLDQITESALEGSEDEDLGTLFGEKVKKQESGEMKLDRLKDEAYSKNSANGKFLQKAIKDYYKYATVEEKRFMMSYLIKDLKVATSGRDFERKRAGSYYASLMKGAGPVMQKILQGIPEKMISTELSDTLSVVKSSLRPISDKYVDSVLAKMAKGDVKRVRKIRSLGAASIAETFLCELETKKGAKKQVVVKILRPDAKLHIDNEAKFLVKLAQDADPSGVMKKSIENHISKVREELDFSIEVQNAIKGAAYNSVDKKEKAKVKSVNINTDVPYGKEYLVMDKAEGETLDRYISKLNQEYREVKKTFTYFDAKKKKNVNGYTPDNLGKFAEFREKLQLSIVQAEKRKNHVYLLTQKWIEKALFGNFFHHGDLHSGNIMISDDCATILDYGNATQFEDDEITPITKMAAGAAISNTDFFVDPMIGLLQKEGIKVTEAQKKAVKERVSEIMKSGGEELTGKKIFVSLLAAQECGITIPRAMNNFSLCEQRLENALDELNGIIISMKQLELQMGELDPIKGMRNEDPLIQYTDDSYANTQKRIKEESATKDKPVAEKDKSIADEKVVELTMEKYGYTDESVMAAHIAAGDKEATDTVKLVQNVAKYYQEHKAFFDSMKKNKAAWMQELKHILALKYDDKVDGATFDVERDKLMDKTAVLMENEAADYLEILGVTNIYDHFEASFIQGNVATAEWLLSLFDERLDMMLAAANDYSTYDTNRQKTFIRASTVEKSRVQAVKSLTEVRNPLKRETGPVRKMFSELRRECIGFDDYKNVKATIKSYTQVNSKEGAAFKNAYDEFLAVESSHAKKKADDSLSSKDIIEYDTAVAKLEKAYEEVTRSELLRLKETAKYRKKTVIKDFNDIIGTEVMSHKLKLAYRLGKDFLSLLSPEAKKEVEAELKKEQ